MTLNSFPFDTVGSDESEFSRMFREIKASGIVGQSDLVVTVTTGMGIAVAAGSAFIEGNFYRSDAVQNKTIAASHASLVRVDLVVLRRSPASNTATLEVVAGTAGAGAPSLTQITNGVYEIPLAQVTVPASASSLVSGNITNLRKVSPKGVGAWTTALRPSSPALGDLGWNHTSGLADMWDGSQWRDVTPPSMTSLLNTIIADKAAAAASLTTTEGKRATCESTRSSLQAQLDRIPPLSPRVVAAGLEVDERQEIKVVTPDPPPVANWQVLSGGARGFRIMAADPFMDSAQVWLLYVRVKCLVAPALGSGQFSNEYATNSTVCSFPQTSASADLQREFPAIVWWNTSRLGAGNACFSNTGSPLRGDLVLHNRYYGSVAVNDELIFTGVFWSQFPQWDIR